jgi:protein involved in ribonucleotide reduction
LGEEKKLLIVFDSKTGNVNRFTKKLGLECVQIDASLIEQKINEPFILVTYTTGFGSVPPTTLDFLESNHVNLQGVAASGNKNWGQNFAISADKISSMYGVPILHKFEMSGMPEDVEILKERVQNIRYETH